jgi:hypothetical protein
MLCTVAVEGNTGSAGSYAVALVKEDEKPCIIFHVDAREQVNHESGTRKRSAFHHSG